jgi:hypothetical protein
MKGSPETVDAKEIANDTVRIANDDLAYEILIIEPGFNAWLVTQPPRGYNGMTFLESNNRIYVSTYNSRVYDMNYLNNLYPQTINYEPNIHYGLEVNYMLYNYFKYFEEKYDQRLR